MSSSKLLGSVAGCVHTHTHIRVGDEYEKHLFGRHPVTTSHRYIMYKRARARVCESVCMYVYFFFNSNYSYTQKNTRESGILYFIGHKNKRKKLSHLNTIMCTIDVFIIESRLTDAFIRITYSRLVVTGAQDTIYMCIYTEGF